MKLITINITNEQNDFFRQNKQFTKAGLIRKLIDEYIKQQQVI